MLEENQDVQNTLHFCGWRTTMVHKKPCVADVGFTKNLAFCCWRTTKLYRKPWVVDVGGEEVLKKGLQETLHF